jgi:hypothetical protein
MTLRTTLKNQTHIKMLLGWRKKLREPLLTLLLVVQILSLFVIPPLRATGFWIPRFVTVAVLLVFVSLATVLSRSRAAMTMLIVSVVLTILGGIWRSEEPDILTYAVSAAGQVLTQLSLLWVVSTAVFGPGRSTHHRILGGIVMYLSIGMIFTSLYILLLQIMPNAIAHIPTDAFDQREALTYFSYSTMTTGSFGDITPIHPIARSLANFESICGQLFPATLLARIVSLHSQSRNDT